MVLSNKKLKRMLRENLAESLTASMSETHSDNNNNRTDSTIPDPNSKPPSLKQLIDSESQKPRLSKRQKRRKTLALQNSDAVDRSSNVENGEEKKGDKIENGGHENSGENKKKKKKKRKRDGDGDGVVENGGAGSIESVEAAKDLKEKKKKKINRDGDGDGLVENGGSVPTESGEAAKKQSKAKKKKKKKKKGKKGKKEEKEKESGEVENGDQVVAEAVKIDDSALNSQGNGDVATKVYVGGIPYYSTEEDIRSYFEGCGTITEVDCMTFPESGKFRGIAMISFKTDAAVKRAMALDGSDMGGLFLKIQPYKTTREHKASDFSPEIVEGYNRIYMGNLSWDIIEDDVKKFFSDCKISSIRFGMDKETGEFRGCAHVDFSDSLSLTMALKLDQQIVCGRPVKIRCAVPKKAGETKKADSKKKGESNKADTKEEKEIKMEDTKKEEETKMADTKKEEETKMADTKKEEETKKADGDGMMSIPSGKIKRRTCYECGEKGHLSSACPNKKPEDLTNPNAS